MILKSASSWITLDSLPNHLEQENYPFLGRKLHRGQKNQEEGRNQIKFQPTTSTALLAYVAIHEPFRGAKFRIGSGKQNSVTQSFL